MEPPRLLGDEEAGKKGLPAQLRTVDVTKRFGGVEAVSHLSFELPPGSVTGLIGPNGAGKTTLLNIVNGIYAPDEGAVWLNGVRIDGRPPYRVARLGVGRTFQVPRIFRRLTVIENVLTTVIHRGQLGASLQQRARELLRLVHLEEMTERYAAELSGGQQKLLEFARALMSDPDLLLLDEPFAGVHPQVKDLLSRRILELNREGKTFLIVSHDMPIVGELCQHVVVMHAGAKLLEGPPASVLRTEAVMKAYLGQ